MVNKFDLIWVELRVNGYLDLSRVDVVPADVAEPSVTLDVFGAVLKYTHEWSTSSGYASNFDKTSSADLFITL